MWVVSIERTNLSFVLVIRMGTTCWPKECVDLHIWNMFTFQLELDAATDAQRKDGHCPIYRLRVDWPQRLSLVRVTSRCDHQITEALFTTRFFRYRALLFQCNAQLENAAIPFPVPVSPVQKQHALANAQRNRRLAARSKPWCIRAFSHQDFLHYWFVALCLLCCPTQKRFVQQR